MVEEPQDRGVAQEEVGARLGVLEECPVVVHPPRNRKIPDREPASPEKNVSGHRVRQEVPVPCEVAGVPVAGPVELFVNISSKLGIG